MTNHAQRTIGVIAVGDGAVVARELACLRVPGVTFALDSFDYPGPDEEFCSGLHDRMLLPAARLRDRGVDWLMPACTTALMACPSPDFTAHLADATGLGVTSVADAMVALMRAIGIATIAIGTPYGARNNALIERFFAGQGIAVAAIAGLDLDRTLDHWLATARHLSPDAVIDLARTVDRPAAVAICLPSTGIASLAAARAVAAQRGKPAITALSAGVWACLDALGTPARPTHAALLAGAAEAG